jgi:hypothetical protein
MLSYWLSKRTDTFVFFLQKQNLKKKKHQNKENDLKEFNDSVL